MDESPQEADVDNSASSTLSVNAGSAGFPLSTPTGCVYQDYGVVGQAYKALSVPISCDGSIASAGQTRSATWYIRTLTSRVFYTGNVATLQGTLDGNGTSINVINNLIRFSGTYTVPTTSGTPIQIGCSGGDYRMTNTYFYHAGMPKMQPNYQRYTWTGTPFTTTVGLTTGLGPDWTFTSYSFSDPRVSVSLNNPGAYGSNSVTLGIGAPGDGRVYQSVAGHWRMIDGTNYGASGTATSLQGANFIQIDDDTT